MADIGVDRLGFVCEERIGGVYERATGIDNVVHEHASIAGNITDYVHHLGLAWAFAALVDDGERRIDPFRQAARTHYDADVGRHYHDIVKFESLAAVSDHHWRCVWVVGWQIEISVDLARM